MAVIPAVCQNCGSIFGSGIVMEGASNVMLKGNRSGPCPVCGDMGIIPDGVYEVFNGIINIFSIDNGEGLDDLKNALIELNDKKASIEDIDKVVKSETPQYIEIVRWLKEFAKENESLFNLVNTLIAVIAVVQSNSVDDGVSDAEFMEVIETQQELISEQNSENQQLREDVDQLLDVVDEKEENDSDKRR